MEISITTNSNKYINPTKFSEIVNINPNKCQSRKNKNLGLFTQCPFNKKFGDYCGKHNANDKKKWCLRVDEKISNELRINYLKNLKKEKNKINKEVEIIDIKEYEKTRNLNYNVSTLKRTLKHYKLYSKGLKNQCEYRLKEHFDSLLNYIPKIKKITNMQIKIKYFLNKRNSFLRGPAIYNRKICNNTEDFYTFEPLEEITFDNFFSFRDKDNFVYGFDIKSFHKLITLKQNNPYNRNIIPLEALKNVEKILEINADKNLLQEEKFEFSNSQQKINDKVLQIFQQIENLTSSVDINWFLNLNVLELKKFYKSLEDIWNYRAELNLTQKIRIVKDSTMFPVTVHKIYKLNNLNKIRNIILRELEKLVFTADHDSDKTLSCYYILTALCDVCEETRIVFPWLIQS